MYVRSLGEIKPGDLRTLKNEIKGRSQKIEEKKKKKKKKKMK